MGILNKLSIQQKLAIPTLIVAVLVVVSSLNSVRVSSDLTNQFSETSDVFLHAISKGLNGGGAGQTGVNFVFRADGRCEWLEGCAEVEMALNDTFCVHTPGGGGWGLDTQS